jgi:hypothetical protein
MRVCTKNGFPGEAQKISVHMTMKTGDRKSKIKSVNSISAKRFMSFLSIVINLFFIIGDDAFK